MKKWTFSILMLSLLLSACASNPSGISTHVTKCCASWYYESFSVTAENIPAFLGPLMVSNFSVALAAKGFQPVMDHADLQVILRYVQTDLTSASARDDFDERIAPGGEVLFIAKIEVDVRDVKTGDIIWSGDIQRRHEVSPGEFMHTGRASVSLLEAFNELLEKFPGVPK